MIVKRLFYRGTNNGGGATDATNVSYDNTDSGLSANNVQEAIDELAASSGSSAQSYVFNNTSSWTGPTVNSTYSFQVPFSTHGKTSPTTTAFERSGSDYIEVEVTVTIDASNNVIVDVPSTPDLRFTGKLIIA